MARLVCICNEWKAIRRSLASALGIEVVSTQLRRPFYFVYSCSLLNTSPTAGRGQKYPYRRPLHQLSHTRVDAARRCDRAQSARHCRPCRRPFALRAMRLPPQRTRLDRGRGACSLAGQYRDSQGDTDGGRRQGCRRSGPCGCGQCAMRQFRPRDIGRAAEQRASVRNPHRTIAARIPHSRRIRSGIPT